MSVTTSIYALDMKKADKEFEKFVQAVRVDNLGNQKYKNIVKNSFHFEEEMFYDVLQAYLELGSMRMFINSPMGEDQKMRELETMMGVFSLDEVDTNIPSQKGFIDLLSKLNKESVKKLVEKFSQYEEYEYEEGEMYILVFLEQLIPFCKELRDNKNSVLIISHDYDGSDVLPEEQNEILKKKIEELTARIKNDKEFMEVCQRYK